MLILMAARQAMEAADAAAQFVERSAAQFVLRDFENLETGRARCRQADGRGCGLNGDGAVAEGFGVKAAGAQFVGDARVFDLLPGRQFEDDGHEERLLLDAAGGALRQDLFEEYPLVGDVLVDDPQAVAAGGQDEAFVELAEGAEVGERVQRLDGIQDDAFRKAAVGVGYAQCGRSTGVTVGEEEVAR